MNVKRIALSAGFVASLLCLAACTGATEDGSTNSGDDQVATATEKTGAASEAVVEAPHACSWAEMDTAESDCEAKHATVHTMSTCTLTSCVATSTTIYYSYTVD